MGGAERAGRRNRRIAEEFLAVAATGEYTLVALYAANDSRPVDVYLDGAIERALFDEKKFSLLMERKALEDGRLPALVAALRSIEPHDRAGVRRLELSGQRVACECRSSARARMPDRLRRVGK